jgi:hypothetical protein
MARTVCGLVCLVAVLGVVVGCSKEAKTGQLSGTVTFKGKPVPAGYISFMPDATAGNKGPIKLALIKDGAYNTALEEDPGIFPGANVIQIAGFDGKKLPYYPQGKQIFNPYELREILPEGTSTKDFTVPPAAANNLKIQPTSDVP